MSREGIQALSVLQVGRKTPFKAGWWGSEDRKLAGDEKNADRRD